jgi:hypothetical protein
MSKKNFVVAPKPRLPTPDEITAFEHGGLGHDRYQTINPEEAPSLVVPAKSVEQTKRLSVDLPASAHIRFKTACSATGRKMVSELTDFIEHRTTELEAEAGITRK